MMTGEDTSGRDGDPVYAYKPSLLGAPWEFRLRPNALEWRMGRQQGFTPYERIARVRLSYRPSTMQSRRFQTEIWSPGGPKLSISSASWRTMVEQERLDAPYGAFIRELHRRIAATGANAKFETGSPAYLYWPGLVVIAGATLAIVGLLANALRLGDWTGAAVVGGFSALFVWQGGIFFYRNRPGSYRPEAVPPHLVP
jgi:hypothetical protein